MKPLNYILLFCLSTFVLNCTSESKKGENLEQLKLCLESKEVTAVLFNERNKPLSELIAEAKINKYGIDKSRFSRIDSLTRDLEKKLNLYSQMVKNKSKGNNSKLYKATEKYLNSSKEMESSIALLLKAIKDTIKENEEDLSIEVKKKALKIGSATREWQHSKSTYIKENNISQSTVDSIMTSIRAEKN